MPRAIPGNEPRRPTRHLKPASPGLPPSHVLVGRERRLMKRHPGKRGRPTNERQEEVIERSLEAMTANEKPRAVAIELGVSVVATTIKDVIKTAREKFAQRAGEYVEIHLHAAQVAAEMGDAKPAQWALERIAEGGERVIDAPSTSSGAAPSFNIGFSIGGVPMPASLPDKPAPAELPLFGTLDGTVMQSDMP